VGVDGLHSARDWEARLRPGGTRGGEWWGNAMGDILVEDECFVEGLDNVLELRRYVMVKHHHLWV